MITKIVLFHKTLSLSVNLAGLVQGHISNQNLGNRMILLNLLLFVNVSMLLLVKN